MSPLLRILVILSSAFDSGGVVNGKTVGTLFIVRQISTSYRPLGRSPSGLATRIKKYCDILYNSIVVSCFCLYIERSVGAVPC